MEFASLFVQGADSAPQPIEPEVTTPFGSSKQEPAQVSMIEAAMAKAEHVQLTTPTPQSTPILQLPPVQLTLPPDSGLEMIETRHHASEPYMEEPQPQRPKRTRPARIARSEEPLEMVETRRDSGDQTPTRHSGT